MLPMSLCASLPVTLHQNSKMTLDQVWFLCWCKKQYKLKQLRGLFHFTFYSPSLREGRVGTQDVGTEVETMETGCLPKVCTSSLLGSPSVTFLMQPGNGSTHTGVGSLPSTSNWENALTDVPMGQSEGPIPPLRFPLPRCVKFTTKVNYDAPPSKSPNRISENFSLNKEHMTGTINLV